MNNSSEPQTLLTIRVTRRGLWFLLALCGMALTVAVVTRQGGSESVDWIVRVNGRYVPRSALNTLRKGLSREGAGREDGLVNYLVDQELLYQYGVGQGLLESDPVVHRRIVQKVVEQVGGDLPKVDPKTLQKLYRQSVTRYTQPPRYRLDLRDIRDRPLPGYGAGRPLSSVEILDSFGMGMARAIAQTDGTQSGVTDTTLGRIRFRVLEKLPAYMPDLNQLRPQLLADLTAQKKRERVNALVARLRRKADIEIRQP